MCKQNGLQNQRLSSVHYSTTERNAAHETIVDCRDCSKSKRKRCGRKMHQNNKGTNSNKKSISKVKKERYEHRGNKPYTPKVLNTRPKTAEHWQLLSSKTGFKGELTGKLVNGRKQAKITKILYGRTRDRWGEMIHE